MSTLLISTWSNLGLYLQDIMFIRGRSTFLPNIRTTENFHPDLSSSYVWHTTPFLCHPPYTLPGVCQSQTLHTKSFPFQPTPFPHKPDVLERAQQGKPGGEKGSWARLGAGLCPSPHLTFSCLFRRRFSETPRHVVDSSTGSFTEVNREQ